MGVPNLQEMPKVELHVHLDGAFDTAFLFEVARKHLDRLPPECSEPIARCGDSLDAFCKLVTCQPDDRTLEAMIDRFKIFTPIVVGDLAAIEELSRRFVSMQAQQNVLYTEVRYSPHILATGYAGGAVSIDAIREV